MATDDVKVFDKAKDVAIALADLLANWPLYKVLTFTISNPDVAKLQSASVILPHSLRPGGHNPIDQLHDLASEGVHYLSDDDSLELYDECRPVFEYLFREIDSRKRSAADYAQNLAKLATSRKSRNP